MTLLITAQRVTDYLGLNSPGSTSQYTQTQVENQINAAQATLEQTCERWFVDRPSATFTTTSMLRAVLPLPGFRSVTSVTYAGTVLDASAYWLQPDAMNDGLFNAIQFRAFRADPGGMPWWYSDPAWFDKMLDSPFYPGNYGGGYAYTSMPNDTIIVGAGGYAVGTEPASLLHAIEVLAGFYVMRPASILADVAITPQGGVLNYAQMPAEVRDFIATYRWAGTTGMVVSVG